METDSELDLRQVWTWDPWLQCVYLDKRLLRPQNTKKLCCCCQVASVMSDSVRPHTRQPTRLPRPWDSPGKNTGVGCHFLLQCMKVKRNSKGPKITVRMRSWGKFRTKDRNTHTHTHKDTNNISEEPGTKAKGLGAKAGYCPGPTHSTPPKRWANHVSHSPCPIFGHAPPRTSY